MIPKKEGVKPPTAPGGRPVAELPYTPLVLTSASQLYNELRGMSWPAVGEFLARRARILRTDAADSRAAIQQNDLKQLKQIVSTKLSHIKAREKALRVCAIIHLHNVIAITERTRVSTYLS